MRRPPMRLGLLLLVCMVMVLMGAGRQAESFSAHVDEMGAIRFPKDFRTTMVHLGSWFVPEGEGWGWALFKPDNPTKNVATNYQADCLGCHVPAKANDWVYIEAYPTLK